MHADFLTKLIVVFIFALVLTGLAPRYLNSDNSEAIEVVQLK